jgi:hypothetical protein
MRWIKQEAEFRDIFLRARTCVYIDSGREQTALLRTTFDDAEIRTLKFGDLLQSLINCSSDHVAHCIILDPDPEHYFYRKFNKYPILEIVAGDSSAAFISGLNEDPGLSPADAIGINWWALVIVPPSLKWFVHALRSEDDNGGHLWIPSDWVAKVREIYPHLTLPAD